jgi:peptidyl-prolyl cis-trans isomerase-like 4
MSILFETNLGDIVIDLEISRIPKSCENFLSLAKLKEFNNLIVSKIEKNFLCLFGEAETDLGSAEFQTRRGRDVSKFLPVERHEKVKHSKIGTVGMINNGHSFYISLSSEPLTHLDTYPEKTTIIGYVEEGVEILTKINETICDKNNVPYNPIRIRHCVILDDGELTDPAWFPRSLPDSPPEIIDELLTTVDDEVDERVIAEREKEAVARAQEVELELMGDLPSADIRPPKNVLFVCQLNPVTEDEDLNTVFSRFGKIKKCEIIRDYKTGDSLQYAFVEFEAEDSCNKAYVAMQNVVIDDKRIKVDFSQSVSKMWNQYTRGEHKRDKNEREHDRSAAHESKRNHRVRDEFRRRSRSRDRRW